METTAIETLRTARVRSARFLVEAEGAEGDAVRSARLYLLAAKTLWRGCHAVPSDVRVLPGVAVAWLCDMAMVNRLLDCVSEYVALAGPAKGNA